MIRLRRRAVVVATTVAICLAGTTASTASAAGGSRWNSDDRTIAVDVDVELQPAPQTPEAYANIPTDVYDLARELELKDGYQTLNSFEWNDDDDVLLVHFHGDPSSLQDIIEAGSLTDDEVELVENPFPIDDLIRASQDLVEGRTYLGEEVSWAAPRADGSGIEVALDVEPSALRSLEHSMAAQRSAIPVTLQSEKRPEAASRLLDSEPFWAGADWVRTWSEGGQTWLGFCTTSFAIGKMVGGSLVSEMLTADHCGPGGATVHTSRTPTNPQLGTLQGASSGGSDIMRIVGKSYQPVVYVGYRYQNDATGVAGWVTPILNGYVCYSGAPSGIVCGNKMTQLNITVAYGLTQIYFGLTRTSQVDGISAAGNGDSGGPVLAVADGKAYAMGVISGMTGSSPHTCQGLPGAVGGRECSSELFFAPVGQFLVNNTDYGILVYGGS